jgi:cytochrome c
MVLPFCAIRVEGCDGLHEQARRDIMTMRACLFILAAIAGSGIAAAQEDLVASGEKVFETTCHRCHTIGAPTKFKKPAPDLNDVFGRKPGGLPDYNRYSGALVAFGQDKVWDEETLTIFLHDPQGVVVNTHMAFLGLQKDEEIKAVLAYLATFDPEGMAPE